MDKKMFVVVALLVLMLAAGCRKSQGLDDSPAATTLRIEDNCQDQDRCCLEKCGSYCQGEAGKYYRHELNGPTCICYCER